MRHEFLRVLTFWCDRGVDGFRIDVSHGLAKDLREPLRDRIDPTLMSPQATDGSIRSGTATPCMISTVNGATCSISTRQPNMRSANRGRHSPPVFSNTPSLMNLVPYSTSPCQRPPGIAKNTAPRLSARIAMPRCRNRPHLGARQPRCATYRLASRTAERCKHRAVGDVQRHESAD